MVPSVEGDILSGQATTQADRVFAKFGGVTNLYEALKRAGRPRDKSVIYRWNLPKVGGGTDGIIPTNAMRDVEAAARLEGIVLGLAELSTARSAPTVDNEALA